MFGFILEPIPNGPAVWLLQSACAITDEMNRLMSLPDAQAQVSPHPVPVVNEKPEVRLFEQPILQDNYFAQPASMDVEEDDSDWVDVDHEEKYYPMQVELPEARSGRQFPYPR